MLFSSNQHLCLNVYPGRGIILFFLKYQYIEDIPGYYETNYEIEHILNCSYYEAAILFRYYDMLYHWYNTGALVVH